jgi:hypothetical protein
MGFSPFLGLLPGGDKYRSGLHTLGLQDVPVNVDAAGLLWQCAFHCKAEYINAKMIAPANWTSRLGCCVVGALRGLLDLAKIRLGLNAKMISRADWITRLG